MDDKKKTKLLARLLFFFAPALAFCAGPRDIEFGGFQWGLRQTSGPMEPGPNTFSNAADQVWVDGQGFLHLAVVKRDGAWTASELMAKKDAGYGTYTLEIDGKARNLDPNIVFGFFTWDRDPAFHNREIDIELSRWGDPSSPLGWFTVQPYDAAGNQLSFDLPAAADYRFQMRWTPGRVEFSCSADGKNISLWSYSGAVPDPGRARLRINLWLFGGRAPSTGGTREIIVKRVSFEALE